MAGSTQHAVQLAFQRVKKYGLTEGQKAILKALDKWFDENPDGCTTREISELSGYSRWLVHQTLLVFEKLGYVQINRRRNGLRMHRGVILMYLPDEYEAEQAG